jgi:endoglycosylceramidase
MTGAGYDRIRGWGFNVQHLRLDTCKLGMAPSCTADPAYLDQLESWVAMAGQRGIYSILVASPGGTSRVWDQLWDPAAGGQDRYLAGWQRVWTHFRGQAAVVGYDVLDEPQPGTAAKGFIHNHLFPFYRRLYAALQAIDPAKAFFFQPPVRSDDGEEGLLRSSTIVWAPHFYPREGNAAAQFRWIFAMAERTGGSVLVGGYGLPETATRDRADALLFDSSLIGTIKPEYTRTGGRALLRPDGGESPRLDAFSRPYPQRVAGSPWNFHFDFPTRRWTFEWTPDGHGTTVVYLPARHYPHGFRLTLPEGTILESDRTSAQGLRARSQTPPNQVPAGFRYDVGAQLLSLAGLPAGAALRLVVTPL